MTIVCWDGETLATDSFSFTGDDSEIIDSRNFNKIWVLDNFIFSVAGNEAQYYSLRHQLEKFTGFNSLELHEDSEAIIFHRKNPKIFYELSVEGYFERKLREVTAIGSASNYALPLLHFGLDSELIVKQCIKYNTGAGGRVNSLNIKEHFEW